LLTFIPLRSGTLIEANPVHVGAASGAVKWTSLAFDPVTVPPSAVSTPTRRCPFAASPGSLACGAGFFTT